MPICFGWQNRPSSDPPRQSEQTWKSNRLLNRIDPIQLLHHKLQIPYQQQLSPQLPGTTIVPCCHWCYYDLLSTEPQHRWAGSRGLLFQLQRQCLYARRWPTQLLHPGYAEFTVQYDWRNMFLTVIDCLDVSEHECYVEPCRRLWRCPFLLYLRIAIDRTQQTQEIEFSQWLHVPTDYPPTSGMIHFQLIRVYLRWRDES